MFKVTNKFVLFLFFIMADLLVLGAGGSYQPFYAMEFILIPYNMAGRNVILSHFVVNFCIYIVYISIAVRRTDEAFSTYDYVLTRTGTTHAAAMHISRIYKELLTAASIKAIADILLGQMKGLDKLDDFLWLTLSAVLTVFIWTMAVFIMKMKYIRTKYIYFFTLVIILILQYAAFYFSGLTVFVIASQWLLVSPVFWMSLKILLLILLFAAVFSLAKNYESIGVEKV